MESPRMEEERRGLKYSNDTFLGWSMRSLFRIAGRMEKLRLMLSIHGARLYP